jgi:hypothetical protein
MGVPEEQPGDEYIDTDIDHLAPNDEFAIPYCPLETAVHTGASLMLATELQPLSQLEDTQV